MAITVTIAGNNKTAFVYRPEGGPPSLRLTMQLGSDWTCEFPLYDTDSTSSAYRPSLGQIVSITDGGTTIFHGTITRIEDKPLKGTGSGTLSMISARAYSGVVDQVIVNETYAAGMTFEAVVTDLRTTYLNAYGITIDGAMTTGPTLEAQVFQDVTLREVFNHLSTISGRLWRITPSDVLEFFAAGEKTASYSLTAANKLSVGPITWSMTREKYVNAVTLRYGSETQVSKTFTATGTGSIDHWVLDYDPAVNAAGYILSRGLVTEGGADLTLSAPGGGGYYTWTAATNTLTRAGGNLGLGVVISLIYTVQFPQVMSVMDTGEVATNGRYSGIFEAPDIFDKAAASELTLGLLRRYTVVPQWVKLSTRQSFVMPGDQITNTFADRTIGGSHIITEVSGMDVFMNGHMQYDLTCLSGDEKQETFTEQLRDVLGSVGGARSAGGTISGSIVPNFSGHFDGDVSANTGYGGLGAYAGPWESRLVGSKGNASVNGPALVLGRIDDTFQWWLVANELKGSSPGTVSSLEFVSAQDSGTYRRAMTITQADSPVAGEYYLVGSVPGKLSIGAPSGTLGGFSGNARMEKVFANSFFEASRSVAMGYWTDVAFSAGNFTAGGSQTWTVGSGDQLVYRYTLTSGKTMTLAFYLASTTVSGTPHPELRIAIPGGFTAAQTLIAGMIYVNDNSAVVVGQVSLTASGSYVSLYRLDGGNWAPSTNNTFVSGTIVLEVM